MRRNVFPLLLFTYLMTVVLHVSLYELATIRIDPVRFVAPAPDELSFRQHGKPVLNAEAAVVWLLLIGTYVGGVSWVVGRYAARRPWSVFYALFASIMIVTFVHPLLLPLLLPQACRAPYVQLLQAIHLPVGAANIAFNMGGILTYVSGLQTGIVFLLTYRQTPNATSGS